MRLDAKSALEKRCQFLSSERPPGLLDRIEEKGDGFFVEFVWAFRSAFARSLNRFLLAACSRFERAAGVALNCRRTLPGCAPSSTCFLAETAHADGAQG